MSADRLLERGAISGQITTHVVLGGNKWYGLAAVALQHLLTLLHDATRSMLSEARLEGCAECVLLEVPTYHKSQLAGSWVDCGISHSIGLDSKSPRNGYDPHGLVFRYQLVKIGGRIRTCPIM